MPLILKSWDFSVDLAVVIWLIFFFWALTFRERSLEVLPGDTDEWSLFGFDVRGPSRRVCLNTWCPIGGRFKSLWIS